MINRIKLQLASNANLVAVVVAIVGVVLLAVAGYVWLNPPVDEHPPEEVEVFDMDVAVTDSATVVNESPLFDVGERLESRPAYFTNISPELDLEVAAAVPDDHTVSFEHRIILEERAVRDDSVVWSRDRLLEANETTVDDGQDSLHTSIHIPDLQAELAAVEEITDPIASSELSIRVETEYVATGPDGDEFAGDLSVAPDLAFVSNAYWLEGDQSAAFTETEMVPQEPTVGEPNPLVVYGLSILGVVLLVGAIANLGWARQLSLEELELQVQHEQYADWISNGQFIADGSYEYVYVDSLVDLINVGIDSDKRVIYDREMEMYQVADDQIIYYYATDPSNIELWADL